MPQKKPKVSVLLSYHNGERFLKSYLENIEQQTIFEDIELVAVTSPLNNKEKELFYSFKEKHPNNIVLFDNFKLGTQSYYWNYGINAARGKYVCIWNVDDIRTPHSIENQYKALVKHPEAIATFGYFIISNNFGDKQGQLIDHSMYSKDEYFRSMLLGPFFMFDASSKNLKHVYFDEQLKSGADFDFAIRLAYSGDIVMTNSVDGYFLDEQKGLSTRGDGLQPIERTVIELRYHILDKVDKQYIEAAQKYDIEHVCTFGKKYPVKEII